MRSISAFVNVQSSFDAEVGRESGDPIGAPPLSLKKGCPFDLWAEEALARILSSVGNRKHLLLCQQVGNSSWNLPDIVERVGLGSQKDLPLYLGSSAGSQRLHNYSEPHLKNNKTYWKSYKEFDGRMYLKH